MSSTTPNLRAAAEAVLKMNYREAMEMAESFEIDASTIVEWAEHYLAPAPEEVPSK